MRALGRAWSLALVLGAGIAFPIRAQAPTGRCASTSPEFTLTRLKNLTAMQHPEALSLANRHTSQVVAYVIDADCRVLAHGTTTRGEERLDIDTTLATLFPNVRTAPFRIAGIAELIPDSTRIEGRPWLVWALVERDTSSAAP